MSFDMQMEQQPGQLPPAYVAQDRRLPTYYGFRTSGMAVMVALMKMAGVVVDEPAPQFPPWPPKGASSEAQAALQRVFAGQEQATSLGKNEQAYVSALQAIQATRSKHPGKVPAFKFQSNEGWLVNPEECRSIALSLSVFEKTLDARVMAKLEEVYARKQAELLSKAPPGHIVLQGNAKLGLTLQELKAWVQQWAAYNEAAAGNGGYTVT